MLVSLFSPKGGVGTTVTSALFSKSFSEALPVLLVDACGGDVHAVVGLDGSPQYCFDDWLFSDEPSATSLKSIAQSVDNNIDVVASSLACADNDEHTRVSSEFSSQRSLQQIETIVDALASHEGACIVDLGQRTDLLSSAIIEGSDIVIMVMRECYLGLWRAMRHPYLSHVDSCVVVQESGRSVTSSEIVPALKLTTVIELDARRDYARTIDAGVLLFRTPRNLIAPIDAYVADVLRNEDVHSAPSHDLFEDTSARNQKSFWDNSDRVVSRSRVSSIENKYWNHARDLLRGA